VYALRIPAAETTGDLIGTPFELSDSNGVFALFLLEYYFHYLLKNGFKQGDRKDGVKI